ncbi:MAG: ribosome biogenesis GTPase YlqF [Oscillospiraceae bacterium]|nr:ribosome biogenesis GTPase YlqF [Oscillospiraceae bacterium]
MKYEEFEILQEHNVNHQQIHWFPGHMMKTLRLMEKEIKNVDVVIVLLDSRIPFSSQNPEIEQIIKNKNRIYILNKQDLADPEITAKWIKYFRDNGTGAIALNSKTGKNFGTVKAQIEKELKDLLERRQSRGIEGAKIRAMLCGIPNVGKSTFINGFAGQQRAKAADKPGVTRGKQWITVDNFELLDMPGVLWRKFDNNNIASNLAFIGSIKDDILDIETLAMSLIDQLKKIYPAMLMERYKLTEADLELDNYDILRKIARKRGMLLPGNEENTERAAIMLCDEFRASKLGKITLERPEDYV